jgi:uncharacterized protein (DUF3084 family)
LTFPPLQRRNLAEREEALQRREEEFKRREEDVRAREEALRKKESGEEEAPVFGLPALPWQK